MILRSKRIFRAAPARTSFEATRFEAKPIAFHQLDSLCRSGLSTRGIAHALSVSQSHIIRELKRHKLSTNGQALRRRDAIAREIARGSQS